MLNGINNSNRLARSHNDPKPKADEAPRKGKQAMANDIAPVARSRSVSTQASATPLKGSSKAVPSNEIVPNGTEPVVSKPLSNLETTFLTKEETRAPSAYYVADSGKTQRSRQEHRSGPSVTGVAKRTQAFTKSPKQAKTLCTVIMRDAAKLGVKPDKALRMAILDGIASPRLRSDMSHVEASSNPVGKGNPHLSGGVVKFPEPGSRLSDFKLVRQITRDRMQDDSLAPVADAMTDEPTPAALSFNDQSLNEQFEFATATLGREFPDR
jgi:hypothetical protein